MITELTTDKRHDTTRTCSCLCDADRIFKECVEWPDIKKYIINDNSKIEFVK